MKIKRSALMILIGNILIWIGGFMMGFGTAMHIFKVIK